jgi:membrane protein
MSAETEGPAALPPTRLVRWRDTLWRLVVSTVGTCFRHRVTGLAAEAAFFALLSLPPLLFGLAGSIGYVFDSIGPAQVEQVRRSILEVSSRALTPQTVDAIVRPTLNDVFKGGRFDVISVGFILALWSGSRALNVFVDTITIMYGLGGHRGVV